MPGFFKKNIFATHGNILFCFNSKHFFLSADKTRLVCRDALYKISVLANCQAFILYQI